MAHLHKPHTKLKLISLMRAKTFVTKIFYIIPYIKKGNRKLLSDKITYNPCHIFIKPTSILKSTHPIRVKLMKFGQTELQQMDKVNTTCHSLCLLFKKAKYLSTQYIVFIEICFNLASI